MKIFTLSDAQAASTGYTHRIEIPYTDLTTAGTAHTQTLLPYTAGKGITNAAFKVVTLFDGGATSELTLKAGWNGGTTDDDDGIFEATSIHADATYIKYRSGNGAAFATKVRGYFPLDAGNYEVIFTSTGANVTVLTQGEVHIYLRVVDLTLV